MCYGIYSPAVLSLTLKYLIPLLKEVRHLWDDEYNDGDVYDMYDGVFSLLGVPKSKQQEIRVQCGSDEDKAVEKCTEWWLEYSADKSWRRVIHSLDSLGEIAVADGVRQYAEPPSGITQGIGIIILDYSGST